MKKLINRIKTILSDQGGESITEGLASVLILSILMLAVATMISASLRITGHSIESADKSQQSANRAVFEEYYADAPTSELVLEDVSNGIYVEIPVKLLKPDDTSEDYFIAFAPKEQTP